MGLILKTHTYLKLQRLLLLIQHGKQQLACMAAKALGGCDERIIQLISHKHDFIKGSNIKNIFPEATGRQHC